MSANSIGITPVIIEDSAGNSVGVTSGALNIAGTITSTAGGSAHVATSQVATSGTAGTLAIARATRVGLLVRNLDTSISVYIGPATVTSGNGMLLKAGESVVVTAVTLWQVIAASGTPTVAIVDEYN